MHSLLSSSSLFADGSGIKPDVLIAELSASQDQTFLPGDLLRGGKKRQQAGGWFLEKKKTQNPSNLWQQGLPDLGEHPRDLPGNDNIQNSGMGEHRGRNRSLIWSLLSPVHPGLQPSPSSAIKVCTERGGEKVELVIGSSVSTYRCSFPAKALASGSSFRL